MKPPRENSLPYRHGSAIGNFYIKKRPYCLLRDAFIGPVCALN